MSTRARALASRLYRPYDLAVIANRLGRDAMASRTILTCDLDAAGKEKIAEVTTSFSLDGKDYELELCPKHRKTLESIMTGYTSAGRKAGGSARTEKVRKRSVADRRDDAAVRAWAIAHGMDVKPMGRIPAYALNAYADAH